MVLGDFVLLALLGACALYLRHLWKQDVAQGRAQLHPVPYPGWPNALMAMVFGPIAAAMFWFGLSHLFTPGITEIDSGRLRGLHVHHRTVGLMMLCVGFVVGRLTWVIAGGFVLERRSASMPPAASGPALVPTLEAALGLWAIAFAADPPNQTAMAMAVRELVGVRLGESVATQTTAELCARLPEPEHAALRELLQEVDRVRFGGEPVDRAALQVMFDVARG